MEHLAVPKLISWALNNPLEGLGLEATPSEEASKLALNLAPRRGWLEEASERDTLSGASKRALNNPSESSVPRIRFLGDAPGAPPVRGLFTDFEKLSEGLFRGQTTTEGVA